MTNQTPLNPDAIFTAGEVIHENFGVIRKIDHLACTAIAERAVTAYLAVAQPVVNSVEELVETRAGLALANNAFQEGLGDGIRACNNAVDGEPFVKPVSPYSAPLLAMIKADRMARTNQGENNE